jgi:peptidoglycan/xylan/chitin deacetylase (PgdA/CDA1 family)
VAHHPTLSSTFGRRASNEGFCGQNVIIQPNQRRRARIFRAFAGAVAIVMVGAMVASSLANPASSPTADATASTPPTAATAATPAPSSVLPTASPLASAPAPTADAHGCFPPPADAVPALVVSHGSRTEKRIALTFDDGTNPGNVRRILGILYREKVNATFFPTGRSVELFPDIWKGVAGLGYPIANHTYSHQSLKGLCYQLQLAELLHDQRVLGGLGLSMLPVMRPPYEEFDEATRFATSAAGESHVVLWDVDTMDWTGISTNAIIHRALAGRAGSIVLMHTSRVNTARALKAIISRYRGRGFTFVTVGTMLGVEGAVPFP